MNQNYLQELIDEVRQRNGGLILNLGGKPEAVVLSIEKYNEILAAPKAELNEPTEEKILFTPKTVLVTGGAGYIGAHIARHLVNAGHKVIVLDNLSCGKAENLPAQVKFIEGDCGDLNLLRDIFAGHPIDAVMHLAASIEVEESVLYPEKYLENNAMNTAMLLSAMNEAGVKNIIFSSTAAVYGQQKQQPIPENARPLPENPYGYSKLIAEDIIKYYSDHKDFKAVVFRYFNACGSDFDGQIKATHESHLLAKLMHVVNGKTDVLVVNGQDYDTHDGTCVRDYVHVLDITSAHLLALEKLPDLEKFSLFNIGTGRGVSVLEMVNAVSESLNKMIPMEPGPKRAGDASMAVADNSKIKSVLGFEPKFSDLDTIAKTAYRQSQN